VIVWEHYASDYNIVIDNTVVYSENYKMSLSPTHIYTSTPGNEIILNLNKLGNSENYSIWYVKVIGEYLNEDKIDSDDTNILLTENKDLEDELELMKQQNRLLMESLKEMKKEISEIKKTNINDIQYIKFSIQNKSEFFNLKHQLLEEIRKLNIRCDENNVNNENNNIPELKRLEKLENSVHDLYIKYNGEYTCLNNKIKNINANIDEHGIKLEELEYDIDKNDDKSHKLQELIDHIKPLFNDDIIGGCENLINIVNQMYNSPPDLKIIQDKNSSKYNELSNNIINLKSSMNTIRAQAIFANTKLTGANNEISSLKHNLEFAENEIGFLKNTINELVHEQKIISNTVGNHINKIDDLIKESRESQEKINNIEQLKCSHKDLSNEINENLLIISKLQNKNEKMFNTLVEKNNEVIDKVEEKLLYKINKLEDEKSSKIDVYNTLQEYSQSVSSRQQLYLTEVFDDKFNKIEEKVNKLCVKEKVETELEKDFVNVTN
jgi:chromosome segregation ATPase